MKVTVVIPNYNGLHFLEACLSSLRKQTYKDFEVLIVDNASVDGSVEFIEKNYPEYRVDVMEKNLGFSGGVNYGIKKATTPYVLLLNNDTESDENLIKNLVIAIEQSDEIFSVSSKMIKFHDREVMDDAGDLLNIAGWAFQIGQDMPIANYTKSKEIFSACAGAALYRREIFEEIGYFDLIHFAYLEDVDLGYRAKIFGYRNIYCANAVVYHVGSGTSGSMYNDFKVRLSARNSIFLYYKNMPFVQRIMNSPFIVCGLFAKYFFFKSLGYDKAYFEGIVEGLKNYRKCNRVTYIPEHLENYCRIEMELFVNFFRYVKQYIKRLFFNRRRHNDKK